MYLILSDIFGFYVVKKRYTKQRLEKLKTSEPSSKTRLRLKIDTFIIVKSIRRHTSAPLRI